MIGKNVTFKEAQEATRANSGRIYANSKNNGSSGSERSSAPVDHLIHIPKFKFNKTAKVFTIGSCFARNIESILQKNGVECPTTKCLIPEHFYEQSGLGARNGALNAYSPQSMATMISLASRSDAGEVGMLHINPDETVDMLVSGMRISTAEDANFIRTKIVDTYKKICNADVVIITLGYTEAWFDTKDGIFVNRSPAATIKTVRNADRYEFLNSSSADVLSNIQNMISDVRLLTNNRVKIILTVSPVPMHATFTSRDVISANLYSKATLISAAVASAEKYDFVDYFPSYEMVSMSPKELVWEDDGIHIKYSIVQRVIEKFMTLYLDAR